MTDLDSQFTPTGKNEYGQDILQFDAPDLTEMQFAEHSAGIIANALEKTGLVQVTETTVNSPTEVAFICRVKKDEEAKFINELLFPIEDGIEGVVETYFAKRYFKKEGKRVFAWNIILQGQLMKDMAELICKVIDDLTPRVEVMEAPLVGNSVQVSSPGQKKRGAAPIQ